MENKTEIHKYDPEQISLCLSILNNIPNPVIITNSDFSIGWVNESFERLTWFSQAEVTGATAPYPWWPSEKHGEYLEILDGVKKGIKHKPEWQFQKKDGSLFWIKAAVNPVKEQGQVQYLLASWMEITEYKL